MLKISILVSVILVSSATNDARDVVFIDRLVDLSEIQNTEDNYIHLAMIVTIGSDFFNLSSVFETIFDVKCRTKYWIP